MKNFVLAVLAIVAIVFIVLYVKQRSLAVGGGGGQSGDANDLTHVKCQSQLSAGPVVIPVVIKVNSSTGIDKQRKIVFVCKGEVVHWDSTGDSNVSSFTVDFGSRWPFNGNPSTLSPSNGVTSDQTVAGVSGKYADCYEYTLSVAPKSGQPFKADPHIIPMGP